MRKSTVLLTTLMVTALISPAPATVLYNVIDLGTGGDWSEPYCINNSGQVVGREVITGGNRAFLYNSGTVLNLGGLPGNDWNAAFSINNAGQIVGVSSGGSGSRAVLFDASGAGNNIDLGPGSAEWINESSTIVGYEYDGYNYTAYIYDITGAGNNTSLGGGRATFISDIGQIVGVINDHAALFDATGAGNNIGLGTLGGDWSVASAINNNGQIIGHSWLEGGWEWYATLFDPSGGGNNINLGRGMAYSINDSGQIVGSLDLRATLFDISGSGNNIDLNTLIDPLSEWVLKGAFYIHNNGWIVGDGVNPAGQDSSYLLVPVPEPSTLLLFGLAAVMLRRKHY